jgi:hypothetical protein
MHISSQVNRAFNLIYNLFIFMQAELEYEELKASFDAHNTKHEILKVGLL